MIKYFILILIALFSCINNRTDDSKNKVIITKEILENANREAVKKENSQIDDFLRRYAWKTTTTATGLRYWVYEKNSNTKIEKGDLVLLDYSITFLNGDTVYSSKKDGVKEFIVNRSNEISGLEEGLLQMSKGDKAKLVVPSFLAYGVTGDFNKISIRNTLVYDINVLNVTKYVDLQ